MERRASKLYEYCHDRLGEGLRAIGYHSDEEVEVTYIRDDVVEHYPSDRVEKFIRASRSIHADLQQMDPEMGGPEASLHVLDEGLIIQFHFENDEVIFLSIDRDIGRDFTRFLNDCREHMT